MAMRRIKKNDTVVVLTGKSKGMQGKILRTKGDKVWIEGANLVKKHVRPNPQANEQGGILEREAPMHISNVAMAVHGKKDADKKYSKTGVKTLEDGRKVRYFKHNEELVDVV